MESLVIIEDSSKSNFGGGQRVTLDFLSIASSKFNKIQIFDFTFFRKTKFTRKVEESGFELFHLFGFGKIGKKPVSSYSVSKIEILFYPILLILNIILAKFLISKNQKGVVYYTATKKAFILAKVIAGQKDKILFHMHNVNSFNLMGRIFRHLVSSPNVINIAVSNFVKESYGNLEIRVVYNGVQKLDFYPKSKIKGKKVVVCYLGSLIAWKGIDILCSSISTFQNNDVELHVIGDGELRTELENKYRSVKKIKFRGFVENVENVLMNEVDILCLPSLDSEACPMSIIESMRFGIPIITTNIGGQAELIRDGVGVLIEPNSTSGIINAIEKIHSNFNNYSKASFLASEKFQMNHFNNEIATVLSEIQNE